MSNTHTKFLRSLAATSARRQRDKEISMLTPDQRKMQAEMQKAQQRFAQDVASGVAVALDRFKVTLEIGDLVVYAPPIDSVYQIMDIKPLLDPRQPAGLVQMILSCTLPIYLPVMQATGNLIKCGHVPTAAQAETNGGATGAGAVENGAPPADGDGVADHVPASNGNGAGAAAAVTEEHPKAPEPAATTGPRRIDDTRIPDDEPIT